MNYVQNYVLYTALLKWVSEYAVQAYTTPDSEVGGDVRARQGGPQNRVRLASVMTYCRDGHRTFNVRSGRPNMSIRAMLGLNSSVSQRSIVWVAYPETGRVGSVEESIRC